MSAQNSDGLPRRFFGIFLETLNAEIGAETLQGVLEKANLPVELIDPQACPACASTAGTGEPGRRAVSRSTSQSAALAYARIQKAMRVYYGRGARGSLVRIGRLIWPRLLASASFAEKAQIQLARTLPPAMRRKAALELLARWMREKPAGATVHTLDLDLMLVDHASATTLEQSEAFPICSVTLGLIQESLFWADGREHDIEEVSCRALGGDDCEFKIKLEGK